MTNKSPPPGFQREYGGVLFAGGLFPSPQGLRQGGGMLYQNVIMYPAFRTRSDSHFVSHVGHQNIPRRFYVGAAWRLYQYSPLRTCLRSRKIKTARVHENLTPRRSWPGGVVLARTLTAKKPPKATPSPGESLQQPQTHATMIEMSTTTLFLTLLNLGA